MTGRRLQFPPPPPHPHEPSPAARTLWMLIKALDEQRPSAVDTLTVVATQLLGARAVRLKADLADRRRRDRHGEQIR